jgi:hypothetical protein
LDLRRLRRGAMGHNRFLCTALPIRRPAGGRRKSLQTECLNAAPLSGGARLSVLAATDRRGPPHKTLHRTPTGDMSVPGRELGQKQAAFRTRVTHDCLPPCPGRAIIAAQRVQSVLM